MSEMDALKHNRIRVIILQILRPEHPRAVDFVLLRRCLADFAFPLAERSLQSYLAYLEERECIRITRNRENEILYAVITAKGLDILDGRIKVAGIEID
jgi:hypothetical protein